MGRSVQIGYPRLACVQKLARFRGCLLGGAVGDALGMPTERMARDQVVRTFGTSVDRFHQKPGGKLKAGQWTDDTLLVLATIDSILRERALNPAGIAREFGRIYKREEKTRGFGDTTKAALRRIAKGVPWTRSGFEGTGNGVTIRISPVALFSYSNIAQLRRNIELVGSITHKDQEAINGGLAVAFVLACIINNTFDRETIMSNTAEFVGHSQVSDKLIMVKTLLENRDLAYEEAVAHIGNSGSVFETVGMSLYAFLKFGFSFRDTVVYPASFGGDSDSIASIAGSLSGAYFGDEAIPKELKAGVEKSRMILAKAGELYDLSHGITSS